MLYVECYPDEVLARTLGVPRREVKHEHGKGNITNRLSKLPSGIGMLDEDAPGFQPAALRNYRRVKQTGKLVLMEHANSPAKRLVLVCPRLEEWLYERAAANGVKPIDYGLPETAARLHSIPRYEQKPKFVEFLQRLHELDPEVKCLKEWISK
ncbi:MAG TPA: hypothetical protein PLW35_07170 [Verrucomicrobiota bacterium]|nr:hypothetical protein [Verrucomicrobiota bacterium]